MKSASDIAMPGQTPYISVVVPHLNQHRLLAHCLESLAAQAYPRSCYEVIVVDNGSTPGVGDLIGQFEGARFEEEAGPGPGPARNRGAAAARGEILAFTDADCVADAGWLAAIAQNLGMHEDRNLLFIGGEVRIAFEDPRHPTMLEAYEAVFAFRQRQYIERKGFAGTGNLAVRRTDFERIGPFAGLDVAEDTDWGHRARALGYRVAYVPEMLVFHPARASFDALLAKWERHVWHQFAARRRSGLGRLAWCIRALAVAASPLVDVPRVVLSPRLRGPAAWIPACAVLVRVRLFRASLMLRLALDRDAGLRRPSWNRL